MSRSFSLLASTLALVLTTSFSHANTLIVTDAAAAGAATGTAAAVPTTAEAKIGTGSWQANGTAKSSIYPRRPGIQLLDHVVGHRVDEF